MQDQTIAGHRPRQTRFSTRNLSYGSNQYCGERVSAGMPNSQRTQNASHSRKPPCSFSAQRVSSPAGPLVTLLIEIIQHANRSTVRKSRSVNLVQVHAERSFCLRLIEHYPAIAA